MSHTERESPDRWRLSARPRPMSPNPITPARGDTSVPDASLTVIRAHPLDLSVLHHRNYWIWTLVWTIVCTHDRTQRLLGRLRPFLRLRGPVKGGAGPAGARV